MNETQGKKIEISQAKAVAIIFGAIVTGMVGGAFGVVRVGVTDHFTVLSHDGRIEALETNAVNNAQFNLVKEQLDKIDKKLDCAIYKISCN